MDKKMTSGEIAKKAGISQKAVRLYDEKGLLKPSDYSEGNYRLYDKEALLVLEKIIALKQIGFSLEEIKDNLTGGESDNILEVLNEQIDLMEAKRYELEKAITRIKAVIKRSEGKPNWDDVAEILKFMQEDQSKDEGHFYALKHSEGELDWYVKIYRYLNPGKHEKVLDLGCGYAKVWRNNWKDIPNGVNVDAYDLPGTWADDFDKFAKEHKEELADGADISVSFSDLECEKTWADIKNNDKYSMILAHYVIDVIKDKEQFIKNASEALKDDGFFSLNCYGGVPRAGFNFWNDVFKKLSIDTKVLDEKMDAYLSMEKECKLVLERYFTSVEKDVVPCSFSFDTVDDILKDLQQKIDNEAFITANRKKFTSFFEQCLEEGPVKIPHDGEFWKLKK